jgi:surfeit locus 1 family protein
VSAETSIRRRSTSRQLLAPSALAMHLVVLSVAALLVSLGQWQVGRLQEVRTSNELLAERMAEDPLDLGILVGTGALDIDVLEFRRVILEGEFVPSEEVLQRNRTDRGRAGFDVLTPLDLGGGMTMLVRRGWVPAALDTPPVLEAAPPAGRVSVTGVLERSVSQPSFGARDPEVGVLQRVFHPDTARLDAQMSGTLLPMVLRLDAAEGSDASVLPVASGPPTLDEGSHLSYAVQWHLFATLALIAYVAWWRTRLRGSASD